MKNDFQRHKKSDGIKWIAVTLAIILLATSVMAVITKGFKDWNPYGWFDRAEIDPNGGVVDGDGNDMSGETVHNLPKNMVFKSSTLAAGLEDGIAVNAIITPIDVANSKVDWSVSFLNPNSAWATGKTVSTYVTATPTADGSLTAKIKCLAPYGEKIKIVVISRDNVSATAVCITDYSKRIESLSVTFTTNGGGAVVTELSPSKIPSFANNFGVQQSSGTQMLIKTLPVYGLGTLEPLFTHKLRLSLSSAFIMQIKNSGFVISPFSILLDSSISFTNDFLVSAFGFDAYLNVPKYNKISEVTSLLSSSPPSVGNALFGIEVVSTSDYSTKTTLLGFNFSRIDKRVESVSFGDTELVF